MKIEFHYAPISGGLTKIVDGEPQKVDGWAAHHELMNEFLNLRKEGKITFQRTINYGHFLFNGHSGKVDIYS